MDTQFKKKRQQKKIFRVKWKTGQYIRHWNPGQYIRHWKKNKGNFSLQQEWIDFSPLLVNKSKDSLNELD